MPTYRLTVAYDGRNFFGWQRHPGQPTIQGALEDAVFDVTGVRAPVEGSGRTDRGTHADAQVASVTLPDGAALGDLNGALPTGIRIVDTAVADDTFHARGDALGKTYRYEIWSGPDCPPERIGRVWHVQRTLDVDAMGRACPHFVGELDFATFAKKPNFERATTVRRMTAVELTHEAPLLALRFTADGFLYKMVRNIVRTLVKVGEGRLAPERIPELFEARDRSAAPGTAPATGLHLESVRY